ncbi:MAG: hypothetical protein A07HR60_01235 [uncultured archaeon A07HR60]|nr:MAG: hypothetical protein A07HR60_01235 [uncultured archaeon A07HR60]
MINVFSPLIRLYRTLRQMSQVCPERLAEPGQWCRYQVATPLHSRNVTASAATGLRVSSQRSQGCVSRSQI